MSDSMRETRLNGQEIFAGRVVRLEVDTIRLPGGGESTREVIRHRGAAVILAILDGRQVLMVRQHRYAVGEVLLELPAGTLEPGENALDCAARELTEETGYSARTFELLGSFYSAPGYTDEVLYAVLARGLELAGEAHLDDDENLELVIHPVPAVIEMIAGGEIRDAKTIGAVMLAQLHGALE